jgi:hypothetical protein
MCFTIPIFSSHYIISYGVAVSTMWYRNYCNNGTDFAQRVKPMIILYAVAVLMAVLLFA